MQRPDNFVDPRHEIWMISANMLSEIYLSSDSDVDWDGLKKNIPSASREKIEKLVSKIKKSQDLDKGDRIFLVMLKLLNDSFSKNGLEVLKRLQEYISEIETTFVPWHIVLENQKRNHHESETDPMKLADLYRIDSTQRAIQDAKAGVPPQQRDQFYRGIMKPPSKTACRRNVFPGLAIYGLVQHLVTVDEQYGAIQIQQVGKPYQLTITGLWFDKDYFKSMPKRAYDFQKPGTNGKNVWDDRTFNEEADISNKKS
ncbi:MAG: hypothetical protein QNJ54_02205 [Prochloraceae cyanobacterium]|nr:hypothetical protein [Prochloraceae cyanobacterium]